MTKEMEFAKCMALLRKAVRMELITEAEYTIARNKLMDISAIRSPAVSATAFLPTDAVSLC